MLRDGWTGGWLAGWLADWLTGCMDGSGERVRREGGASQLQSLSASALRAVLARCAPHSVNNWRRTNGHERASELWPLLIRLHRESLTLDIAVSHDYPSVICFAHVSSATSSSTTTTTTTTTCSSGQHVSKRATACLVASHGAPVKSSFEGIEAYGAERRGNTVRETRRDASADGGREKEGDLSPDT